MPKFVYFLSIMAVEIKEITSKRDLLRFVQFGNEFYKDCDNFCPSLILDEMDTFNLKKNPAFEVCEHVLYMAYRDGKAVEKYTYHALSVKNKLKINLYLYAYI